MKIVVTGASGLIGTELLRQLRDHTDDNNIEVIPLSRSEKDGLVCTDYSVESLSQIFDGADVIIHLAARRGAAEQYTQFQENDFVTENILRAMKAAKVKRIIFMSSISVYSSQHDLPWSEEQHPIPQTFYALSKLAGEGLCQLYARKGISYTIFRCAIVLGLENSGRMLSTFVRQAANGERISLRGKSEAKRDFIYVKEAARALIWAIFEEHAENQIYNLGSNEQYTNLEVAQRINKVFANEGNLDYDDTVKEKVTDSYMDSSKLYKAGYVPKYHFESALLDIREEYKKR